MALQHDMHLPKSVGHGRASRKVDYLLVGGGLASATAAETLRQEGAEGSIVIVGAEDRLPYHRPPLSGRLKNVNAPSEPVSVLKEQDFRSRDIELLRGVRALALDPHRRVVSTDKAGTLAYGKLLIATGASPIRLQVPGAGLPGIHYLRTVDDERAIRSAAERSRACVVIGASFIGMEVSSGLRQRGLEVVLVSGGSGVFGPLRDQAISRFFASLYAQRGIRVIQGKIARFQGDAAVQAVVLEDGLRIACDFVVAGIGVRPDVEWLTGSGVAVDDGVVVDSHLQTSVADVYAAGDAANFFDPVFNVQRRIEHWDNAVKQGRLAARNMLGERHRYDEVPGYFCQVFDANFHFLGRAEGAQGRRSLGSPKKRAWARLYLRDKVPRALFTMGRPARESATIEALIRYRTNIERFEERLSRPGYVLDGIPSQTVLVLQGGGALGAFECGVVKALEQRAIHPDIVAGVSIGAFNGAIVASHPRHAAQALEAFWSDLAIAAPPIGDERLGQLWGAMAALMFGVPRFFTPRWLNGGIVPQAPFAGWTSFYDHAPARRLLQQYVDFEALKASPVRLLVSAVDVETAQLTIFDSYIDELTVDHLLASGSLPPGLPWTKINGRHYWDGGIVSNSPLEMVVDRCGAAGKRVIAVDLFAHARPLPSNMMEVLARRDEIVYAQRIRRAGAEQTLLDDTRKLVDGILSMMSADTAARVRQLPAYVQLMGAPDAPTITRIMRESTSAESAGRDFDFSLPSIQSHVRAGLAAASRTLDSVPMRRPAGLAGFVPGGYGPNGP